ncbi:winged helix domain-containing protein [Phyllobacterium sp. 22552]|uniref:winged helix domain-containing protein n=1 Tax=Phyllobacterium sp. 22552 TaxID=3453941 RepID=UPI003F829AC6
MIVPFTSNSTTAKRGAYKICAAIRDEGKSFILTGRVAWTAEQLVKAGSQGITTMQFPGVRLSEHVRVLRHDFGIEIETIVEKHDGPFPGSHGIYKLVTELVILKESEVA